MFKVSLISVEIVPKPFAWGVPPFIPLGDFMPNSLASSLINLKLWSETRNLAVKYTAQTQTRLTGVELDREGPDEKY